MNATEDMREVMKELTELARTIASLRIAPGAECVVIVTFPTDASDPESDHTMRVCSTLPPNHTVTMLAEIAREMVNDGHASIDRERYIRDPDATEAGAMTP